MISRRHLLSVPLATLLPASALHAQQRRSLDDPMRLGVDTALFDAGLAKALQQGFGRDTGVAVKLVSAPALPLLEGLDRGEVDAALTNVPEAEIRREQQGLAHDRHAIARGDFVLVGPAPRGKAKDPAGIRGMASATEALIQLHHAALAGHAAVVELFVDRGARLDLRDRIYSATPLGWAQHAGKRDVEAFLRSRGAS